MHRNHGKNNEETLFTIGTGRRNLDVRASRLFPELDTNAQFDARW